MSNSDTPQHGHFAGSFRAGQQGQIRIAYTNASSGSFDLAADGVELRRRAITGLGTVSWLRQHHGTTTLAITEIDPTPLDGPAADAAITNQADHAVSVITADCAPIALWTEGGVVGAVHAGWRGLEAGIIERTVEEMRLLSGESEVSGWLGPCIGAECYEFGEPELTRIANRYGDAVRSTTVAGAAALDMTAGVRAALGNAGALWAGSANACTACDVGWYSWRARKSTGRQALFVWRASVANS
jgi:YfiH family protein